MLIFPAEGALRYDTGFISRGIEHRSCLLNKVIGIDVSQDTRVLGKIPHGKVPAFERKDGTIIFDSDAIARYVAESGPLAAQLVGETPQERAVIQQWINFATTEIITQVTPLVLWRFGVAQYDTKVEGTAFERLERTLTTLEHHLQGREWVATEDRLSLADVTVVSYLIWGFAVVIDAELRAKYPSVVAWYERVYAMVAVRLPPMCFCPMNILGTVR